MKTYEITDDLTTQQVAKRIVYLAWQACGGPTGMGFLQDRPNATEEEVWKNAVGRLDYPGEPLNDESRIYADYVFGRMMKLSVRVAGDKVLLPTDIPRRDYQGWCGKYPTYDDLFLASVISLTEG